MRDPRFERPRQNPEWQQSAIDQLVLLSGTIVCPFGTRQYPIQIECVDSADAPEEFERYFVSSRFLRFTITYDAEVVWNDFSDRFVDMEEGNQAEIRKDVLETYPIGFLHNSVDWILFASFIAWPGAIQITTRGKTDVDGRIEDLGDESEFSIGFNLDDALKRSWPKIEPVETGMVWRWLESLEGFENRLSSGNVSRAVAALSQIVLGREWESAELIWAMVGLEALYGDAEDAVGTQLRRKSELLLGPPGIDVKGLKDSYRYRSKFVHGKVEIPFCERRAGYESHYPFHRGQADAAGFATGLLLASIQELIRRGRSTLEYDYFLVGGRP